MTQYNYAAAQAIITTIADKSNPDFSALGITKKDHEIAHSDLPWLREQRAGVVRTLKALLHGSADLLGLDQILLPTEYVAAIIATFVAPQNHYVAACWLAAESQQGLAASEIMNGNQVERATASELFAITVELLQNDGCTQARKKFESRIQNQMAKAA